MKKLTILIGILTLFSLLSVGIVSAGYTFYILSPSNLSTQTNRAINYSFSINATDINQQTHTGYNVTIYRNGTTIFGPFNYTNATFYNHTINTVNGFYDWRVNITNGSETAISNTINTSFHNVTEPSGTYSFGLLAPNDPTSGYNVLGSTTVNFSFSVNTTGNFLNSTEQLSCDIQNRSSSLNNFSNMLSLNVTNATFTNKTVTLNDDTRYFWRVNCSTVFNPTSDISNAKIVDIDVEEIQEYNFNEVINFSLANGNATFKGSVTAPIFYGAFSGNGENVTGITSAKGIWNSSGTNTFLNDTNGKIALGLGNFLPNSTLDVVGNTNLSYLEVRKGMNVSNGLTIQSGNLVVTTTKVGIGQLLPNASLEVAGNTNLSYLEVKNGLNLSNGFNLLSGNLIVGLTKVGIGQLLPNASLDVSGNTNLSYLEVRNGANVSNGLVLQSGNLFLNTGSIGVKTTIANATVQIAGNLSTGSRNSIDFNGIQVSVLFFTNGTTATNSGLIPPCNNETTDGAWVYNASLGNWMGCVNGTSWRRLFP